MKEKRDKKGLTEREAIERYKSKNYPRPALTADVVMLSETGDELKILLIERGGHPFLGYLALPGGFADENEPVEETARRELMEETGIDNRDIKLVGIYSRPGRDPRGWVVSAAFMAKVDFDKVKPVAADDAASAAWYTLQQSDAGLVFHLGDKIYTQSSLAFDHAEVITDALKMQK